MDARQSSGEAAPAACSSCLGYGFRVYIGPGRTLNAKAALDNGRLDGERKILCGCQAVKESVTVPEFKAAPKPKARPRKRTVAVAGIKASAYVDAAEA